MYVCILTCLTQCYILMGYEKCESYNYITMNTKTDNAN